MTVILTSRVSMTFVLYSFYFLVRNYCKIQAVNLITAIAIFWKYTGITDQVLLSFISGVTEAVVRGSVTKNIAKFEKKLEEAEQERERSISPKRSPSRRGKMAGRGSGRPRSALSPERKAGSPERKVKHRVSWGDDQIVQVRLSSLPISIFSCPVFSRPFKG